MSTEQELTEIEISLSNAKYALENANCLARLYKNKDFKHLVLDGYFVKQASRCVMNKAAPGFQTEDAQGEMVRDIDSIGRLKQYFVAVNAMGEMAMKSLADDSKTQEEILAEDL